MYLETAMGQCVEVEGCWHIGGLWKLLTSETKCAEKEVEAEDCWQRSEGWSLLAAVREVESECCWYRGGSGRLLKADWEKDAEGYLYIGGWWGCWQQKVEAEGYWQLTERVKLKGIDRWQMGGGSKLPIDR